MKKSKQEGGRFDFMDKAKTLFANLKSTLIPLALAIIAVAIAARWAKRGDKDGKPTLVFPLTALGVAWLLPEMLLRGRQGGGTFGGFITVGVLRMAGAFAFILALTFDDILGPIVEKARMGGAQVGNFVSKIFWWGAELFGGKDAAVRFTSRSQALPASTPAAPPAGSSSSYQSENFDAGLPTVSATPPAAAPVASQPVVAQPSGGGGLLGSIFNLIGAGVQAAPGIISALNQGQQANPQNAPGSGAGMAPVNGVGSPYMTLAYNRAA